MMNLIEVSCFLSVALKAVHLNNRNVPHYFRNYKINDTYDDGALRSEYKISTKSWEEKTLRNMLRLEFK